MRPPLKAALFLCLGILAAAVLLDRGNAIAQSAGGVSAGYEQSDQGEIPWNGSISLGSPNHGALIRGVELPPEGTDFFTWDFPLRQAPNREWRRWGADTTVHTLLRVISEYRLGHPGVQRVGIADISRPRGGPFGRRFGGLGHASHQNGLDVDVLYPRRDALELAPSKATQINRLLSQDLVNRFVAAGAVYVFVGSHTKLTGPKKIVQKLVHHDDHMHVRFGARGALGG